MSALLEGAKVIRFTLVLSETGVSLLQKLLTRALAQIERERENILDEPTVGADTQEAFGKDLLKELYDLQRKRIRR